MCGAFRVERPVARAGCSRFMLACHPPPLPFIRVISSFRFDARWILGGSGWMAVLAPYYFFVASS